MQTRYIYFNPFFDALKTYELSVFIRQINNDFFHVCGKGDIEYADILLDAGWDVNARDKVNDSRNFICLRTNLILHY